MNKDQNLLQEAYEKVANLTPRNKSEWDEWLSNLDHKVHEDGSITIYGGVDFEFCGLTEIPFNFREVTAFFDCDHNPELTSLRGAPQKVGGSFWANYTGISSLEGGPKEVVGEYSCRNNDNLTSLDGGDVKGVIKFSCYNNPNLKSPRGIPKAERYNTQFSDEEIKRELYRQEIESKMEPETKDVFGDLLADL